MEGILIVGSTYLSWSDTGDDGHAIVSGSSTKKRATRLKTARRRRSANAVPG